jgi:hypothetical protein
MKQNENDTHHEKIQAEVQEIAEVLSRQSGRSTVEVWNEAISLHRVRYETKVIGEAILSFTNPNWVG